MKFLISFLQRFATPEQSPQRLALTFCIGNYIAFSPYIGLHTLMAIVMSYCFGLSLPILIAVSYGINNPWTAIPLYALDYGLGYWLVHKVFCVGHLLPMWPWLAHFFEYKLSLPAPCLWSFLIGGNLLAMVTSVLLYPVMLKLFTILYQKQQAAASTS